MGTHMLTNSKTEKTPKTIKDSHDDKRVSIVVPSILRRVGSIFPIHPTRNNVKQGLIPVLLPTTRETALDVKKSMNPMVKPEN
jgi:hypothetical protein